MSYRVQVLPAAELDAWKIFRKLNKKSHSGADRWYSAFLAATEELFDRPERTALAPEAKRIQRPIREAFFKTPRGLLYRLIYLNLDDEVRIVRVRAPGQRPLRSEDLDEEPGQVGRSRAVIETGTLAPALAATNGSG